MSDIGRARDILRMALRADDIKLVRRAIQQALDLMERERPEFKTKIKLPPMTREQVLLARELRGNGLPLNEIARKLGTNIGRVSEAINGLREGI